MKMLKKLKRALPLLLSVLLFISIISVFSGCSRKSSEKKERVVIFTSSEDYGVEFIRQRLNEEFPDYDIKIEYLSSGNHAAKLLAERKETDCDITHDLEYGYLGQLEKANILADLSSYDTSIYTDDAVVSNYFMPEARTGGAIIINPKVLDDKGLEVPNSYDDLLKPEYKKLISMPNPKSSGTGYMFLKALVNSRGEEKAFEYFDNLAKNVLSFTSSGSGPVNALIQNEVAIGLGMTAQAVTEINKGGELMIKFFEEGSPFNMYGQSIISGKETKEGVKKVFDFLVSTLNAEYCAKFFPEKFYKEKDFSVENFPENIKFCDMSNNSSQEKTRLLEKWKY